MPRLCAIETSVPPHKVGQDRVKDFARQIFQKSVRDIERLMPVFENAGIDQRYFTAPLEWFAQDHSLAEKNELYIRSATELGASAIRSLLDRCVLAPGDIDAIFYINTTGLATPSIDARLVNVLGLRTDIRRIPIWGLGCAGGAAGLSHAHDYLVGHPSHRALVVAVELCGLTFLPGDHSKSNVVATALFGEGAAAALMCGDDVESEGVQIVDVQSTFYPDSLEVMGWNIVSEGMQVVFNKRIPDIVAEKSAAELDRFLARNQLTRADITHFLYHPGGMKVLQAYHDALGLRNGGLDMSRGVLRDYGNMSSATVLFVVERYLRQPESHRGQFAVISALGPGFCSESLLISGGVTPGSLLQ